MCQPPQCCETAKGFKKCGYVPMGGWGSDESCDRWARAVTRCRNTWERAKTHNRTIPETPPHVENITQCLSFIGELGVSIEGVTSKDVREGNLKVILSLFFNLSRYKQAQKNSSSVASKNTANSTVTSSATSTNVNTAAVVKSGMVPPSLGSDMLSKLPSPFRPSSGRSIPCPSNKDAGSSIPSSSNPSAVAGSRKNKLVASSTGQQEMGLS
ncbi:Neuron navigator 3 like protein [Argiope bruennichi]|uniref:Neuron navigator 3 like protein n=1 Tax=Argiope bruennichi TaxID=94029 RepID=A0A8T0EYE6_ARGBR|nr:Neuron navigator 3 like protein [Argiope bruennichi]